jgi:hypothetical protein
MGHEMLLDQTVQRGQFQAMALAVDQGAGRWPLAVLAESLHAKLPRLWTGTVQAVRVAFRRPL